MKTKQPPLTPGDYFHIYNRGNNRQQVFYRDADYQRFLFLWERFIDPFASTLAFSLLPNHFHAVIRIRESCVYAPDDSPAAVTSQLASQGLTNFFISFSKASHMANGTDGAVFKRPCQRKLIDSDQYLQEVIAYVLLNAYRHGLVPDYRDHAYSSLPMLTKADAFVDTKTLLRVFGGMAELFAFVEAAKLRPFSNMDG